MRSVSLIHEAFQNLEKQRLDLPKWVPQMNQLRKWYYCTLDLRRPIQNNSNSNDNNVNALLSIIWIL